MSANKPAWTSPGPVEQSHEAAEARKGTAAADPVLSLAPDHRGHRGSAADASPNGQQAPDKRTPAEIEADIELTRNRLAGTLDELTERLSPRAALRKANKTARGAFVTPDGDVRKGRAAMVAGAVTGVLGAVLALRLRKRG